MSLETCLLEPTLAVEHPEATKGNKQAIDFMQNPFHPNQGLKNIIRPLSKYPHSYQQYSNISVDIFKRAIN
jgi:hypothetical protein